MLQSLITFGFCCVNRNTCTVYFYFVGVRKAGFRSKIGFIISFSSSALWSNAGICFGWHLWG